MELVAFAWHLFGFNLWNHRGRNSFSSLSGQDKPDIIWLCRITIPFQCYTKCQRRTHTVLRSVSFVLPYCIAHRLLGMLHHVLSFRLFPLSRGGSPCHDNSMWWKGRHLYILTLPPSLNIYKRGGKKLVYKRLISVLWFKSALLSSSDYAYSLFFFTSRPHNGMPGAKKSDLLV